jgi:hypothetical protein
MSDILFFFRVYRNRRTFRKTSRLQPPPPTNIVLYLLLFLSRCPSVRQFSLSFSLSLPRESSSVSDLASSWKEREEGESQREARSVQVSVWSLEAQNRQRSAAAAFLCYSHSVPSVSLSDTLSVKVQSYTI